MDAAQIQTAVMRIKRGECTPIISNQLILDQYFGQEIASRLAAEWARSAEVDYPLELEEDKYSIAGIAEYYQTTAGASTAKTMYHEYLKKKFISEVEKSDNSDLDDIKNRLESFTFTQLVVEKLQHPGFGSGCGPAPAGADGGATGASMRIVDVLAQFNVKVFITTSPHTFIERALEKQRKTPTSQVYDWMGDADDGGAPPDSPSGERYKPDIGTPLVYHLLGKEDSDDSLVLSEDDLLRLLPKLVEDRKMSKVVPLEVRDAVARNYLLLLGFDVDSWEFRVVLRGLISTQQRPPKGIAVQIDPNKAPGKVVNRDAYQGYLRQVFGHPDLSVFEGTPCQLVGLLGRSVMGG